ncbi:uncharacterized protein LOC104846807 [Loxodonta africana]|uniref:uncharacterized protein LOC104846807 n=1 Tax=Loxodonta africana TaxID=9785 RepID=UPI00054038DD
MAKGEWAMLLSATLRPSRQMLSQMEPQPKKLSWLYDPGLVAGQVQTWSTIDPAREQTPSTATKITKKGEWIHHSLIELAPTHVTDQEVLQNGHKCCPRFVPRNSPRRKDRRSHASQPPRRRALPADSRAPPLRAPPPNGLARLAHARWPALELTERWAGQRAGRGPGFRHWGVREPRGKAHRTSRRRHKARGQRAGGQAPSRGAPPVEPGCRGAPTLRDKLWRPWNGLIVIGKRMELLGRNTTKPRSGDQKLEPGYWRMDAVERTDSKEKPGLSKGRVDLNLLHSVASALRPSADVGKGSPREIWAEREAKRRLPAVSESAVRSRRGSGFEESLRSTGEKVQTYGEGWRSSGEDMRSRGYKLRWSLEEPRSSAEKKESRGERKRLSDPETNRENLRSRDHRLRSWNGEKPKSSAEKLVTSAEKRGSSAEKLGTSGEKLGSRGEKLRSSGEKLGTSAEKLRSSGEKLVSKGEKQGSRGEKLRSSGEKLRSSGEDLRSTGDRLGSGGEKLGSSQEKLGTSPERLRSSRERLGASREKLGTSRERLGASQEKLGTSREKLGTSQLNLVTSQEKLRASRERLGTSQLKPGTSREKLGTSEEKLESSGMGSINEEKIERVIEVIDSESVVEVPDENVEIPFESVERSDEELEQTAEGMEVEGVVLSEVKDIAEESVSMEEKEAAGESASE